MVKMLVVLLSAILQLSAKALEEPSDDAIQQLDGV